MLLCNTFFNTHVLMKFLYPGCQDDRIIRDAQAYSILVSNLWDNRDENSLKYAVLLRLWFVEQYTNGSMLQAAHFHTHTEVFSERIFLSALMLTITLVGVKWHSIVVSNLYSLMMNDVLMCCWFLWSFLGFP